MQGRGFDLVISYAHKCQKDATALKTFIKREFQQQLPIVCLKCISEAVKCFDELNGMLARDLIHKWKSNTEQKECQKKWTEERNLNFFSVMESLESRGHDVKPTTVLNAMSANERGLTVKQVNSHMQVYLLLLVCEFLFFIF
nr:uncharacterized protein LOC109153289 isoform X4 [Ipomoea batatas]